MISNQELDHWETYLKDFTVDYGSTEDTHVIAGLCERLILELRKLKKESRQGSTVCRHGIEISNACDFCLKESWR